MAAKFKIALFAATALILMASYNHLYQYSFDAPRLASWWLKDVLVKKEQISDGTLGKRIIIISGSNGLLGFDGERLEVATGLPVVNFALHASLDLNFFEFIAERNIRKGDVVVIPLEYNYYTLKDPYNFWFIDNMLAWGKDYLDWVSPVEYWKFLSHVELQKVAFGAMSVWYINNGSFYKSKLHSKESISSYQYDGGFHGYNFQSVDNTGGMIAPNENKRGALNLIENQERSKAGLYYMKTTALTNYGLDSSAKLIKLIESLGATVIATWPTSMKTPYFNKDDALSQKMISNIRKEMLSRGVTMHCSPWDVNIEQKKFFDTAYHLTRAGAEIRSDAVAKCLKEEGFY